MPAPLTLEPVTAANWRTAMLLRVTPAQRPFVADHHPVAAIALAKAHVGAMGHIWSPLLMRCGTEEVGFLALTRPAADPAEAWLFHFFVDYHHQRRGHATAAMQAAIVHLAATSPPATSLNLLVDPANAPAHALYRASGLAFTGRRIEGDLHMARPLP